jgi:hypothetical protein
LPKYESSRRLVELVDLIERHAFSASFFASSRVKR